MRSLHDSKSCNNMHVAERTFWLGGRQKVCRVLCNCYSKDMDTCVADMGDHMSLQLCCWEAKQLRCTALHCLHCNAAHDCNSHFSEQVQPKRCRCHEQARTLCRRRFSVLTVCRAVRAEVTADCWRPISWSKPTRAALCICRSVSQSDSSC